MSPDLAAVGTSWLTGVLADPPAERMLFLNRADVVGCLDGLDVVDVVANALRDHHAGRTVLPSEGYLAWTNDAGAYTRSIAMPAAVLPVDAEAAYGVKIVNASVSNPQAGIERAGGLGLCFDHRTARVCAVMEVGVLSAARTAAVTAIALDAVGWARPASIAVIGCGTQARMHLALLLRRYGSDLPRVTLHDTRERVASALAADLAARHPSLTCAVVDSVAVAVAGADVVLFLTTATTSYVPRAWVRDGSVLVNVSLGDLTDEVLVEASALYVDDLPLIRENPRRPLGRLLNEGRLAERATPGRPGVTASLGELLAGDRVAARVDGGYVVVNPFGIGVLDVALFAAVRRRALASAAGQWLSMYR